MCLLCIFSGQVIYETVRTYSPSSDPRGIICAVLCLYIIIRQSYTTSRLPYSDSI